MSRKIESRQVPPEANEAFHVAKLALTNVRLLNDIENARSTSAEICDLVKARAGKDGIRLPVSLLHQATFLQFAYVCLVWLWERARADQINNELVEIAEESFDFKEIMKTARGPRDVNSASEVLRLLRNAISHARVKAEKNVFIFEDVSNSEPGLTSLSLTWPELGQVSEAVLSAFNSILYDTRS